jgi:hypothetical protein
VRTFKLPAQSDPSYPSRSPGPCRALRTGRGSFPAAAARPGRGMWRPGPRFSHSRSTSQAIGWCRSARTELGSSPRVWTRWHGCGTRRLGPSCSHSRGTLTVTCAGFSADGPWLVTGSLDKSAKARDAKTGAELLTLSGHTVGVISAAFNADGSRLVTGSGEVVRHRGRGPHAHAAPKLTATDVPDLPDTGIFTGPENSGCWPSPPVL